MALGSYRNLPTCSSHFNLILSYLARHNKRNESISAFLTSSRQQRGAYRQLLPPIAKPNLPPAPTLARGTSDYQRCWGGWRVQSSPAGCSAQKPDLNVVPHHRADGAAVGSANGTCHSTACHEPTPRGTGAWSLTKTANRFPRNSFQLTLTEFSSRAQLTSKASAERRQDWEARILLWLQILQAAEQLELSVRQHCCVSLLLHLL